MAGGHPEPTVAASVAGGRRSSADWVYGLAYGTSPRWLYRWLAAREARRHAQGVEALQWVAEHRDASSTTPSTSAGTSPRATNTAAVLALVFGIGGGVLGVVFGHLALSQIRRTGEAGRGMAIAGLVLGYIGCALILGAVLSVTLLRASS